MKKIIGFLFALLLIFFYAGTSFAVPSTYVDNFPSADATVVASVGTIGADEFGYFWSVSRGDSITESFSGTGLAYAYGIDLSFQVTRNVLISGATVDWDVLVNGITVGNWSWGANDGTGLVDLSYSFADIYGSDTYEIAMVVSNEVAPGAGSIAIGYPGSMTIYGDTTTQVPEPATILLLGAGLVGLAGASKKKFIRS